MTTSLISFTVRHFVTDVTYDVKGFVDKNKDLVILFMYPLISQIHIDVLKLMKTSTFEFISCMLFIYVIF